MISFRVVWLAAGDGVLVVCTGFCWCCTVGPSFWNENNYNVLGSSRHAKNKTACRNVLYVISKGKYWSLDCKIATDCKQFHSKDFQLTSLKHSEFRWIGDKCKQLTGEAIDAFEFWINSFNDLNFLSTQFSCDNIINNMLHSLFMCLLRLKPCKIYYVPKN